MSVQKMINPNRYKTVERFIRDFVEGHEADQRPLLLVQVGANDGIQEDALQAAIIGKSVVRAHLVEAVPFLYASLCDAMASYAPQVRCHNYVIADKDEKRRFFYVSQSYAEAFPEQAHWKKYQVGSLTDKGIREHIPEAYIESKALECLSPQSFCLRSGIRPQELDALFVDAEGFDGVIVRAFLEICSPSLIVYEHRVMPAAEAQALKLFLLSRQYRIKSFRNDNVCMQRSSRGLAGTSLGNFRRRIIRRLKGSLRLEA